MFKFTVCFFFILISAFTSISVCAENEVSAFLSDANVQQNKLFETTLSVNIEISAFIAVLEFDESKVEFREATALSEDTALSVNNSEKGKVALAFLNEQGTKGEIIELIFKSKTENTFIDLSLEQVIDSNASDVTFKSVKGAEVIISSESADKISPNKEKEGIRKTETCTETHTKPSESDTHKGELNLYVPAKNDTDSLKFIYISVAVLILSVGVTGFFVGKNFNSKNKNRKNNYEKDS